MVQGFLKFTLHTRDLAELVIGVDLVRINTDRFLQVLQCAFFLPALKVDQGELDVGVRVPRVDDGVVKKAFEVLFLSESVAEPAHFTAEIQKRIVKEKRRKQPRRDVLKYVVPECERKR